MTPSVDIGSDPTAQGAGNASDETWSLLSGMMAIAAALTAILLLAFAYARKRKYNNYEDELDDLGLLTEDRQDALDSLRKKGRLLKALAIIVGAITALVWLFFDWPLQSMVWINSWTPWVAIAFAATMALTLAFNLRKKDPEDEDGGEDNDEGEDFRPIFAK